MASPSWDAFLDGHEHGHAVQIYAALDELADSVRTYLSAGFSLGEPAVVLATDDHFARFQSRLTAAGWSEAALEREGLLFRADAQTTLDAIMDGTRPSADAFEREVGGLLDAAATRFPGRKLRVFGELVELLTAAGNVEAAIELEDLWNDIGSRREFSLLCAYRLDVFDHDAQTTSLPDVCRVHSHVRPAQDTAGFARAVDEALEETLGYEHAGKVYFMVNQQQIGAVPIPQQVLMWLSRNMPSSAQRVLNTARERYYAEPVPD